MMDSMNYLACKIHRELLEQSLRSEKSELDGYSDIELAIRTIGGEFGYGDNRIYKLGDRYKNVQSLVNGLMALAEVCHNGVR